jgi:hypothetical protein
MWQQGNGTAMARLQNASTADLFRMNIMTPSLQCDEKLRE